MTTPHDLHRALAEFARDLLDDETTSDTVGTITHTVVRGIDGADAAGIFLLHRRKTLETLGATDPVVERADQLQFDLGEGPCLDAIEHDQIHSPDLATDDRWPRWTSKVVEELGVASMLCLQLFVHERQIGALNLYSRRTGGFTTDDIEEVRFYAAQAAVAVATAQQIEQLRTAMATRNRIGQAQGIIMERFDVDESRAFALLTRLSQDRNVRLHRVADELVRTRKIPVDDA